MAGLKVILFRVLVGMVCWGTTLSQGNSCNLSQIQVKEDFDPIKYAGKWYEIRWLPLYFDTEDMILVDYTETYTPTDTGMDAEGRGRSGTEFTSFTKVYTKSGPGKYYTMKVLPNETVQVDYWIVATDYDHYSLVYGCTVPQDGVCMRAHAWIWSRQHYLEDQYFDIIKPYLPGLCLEESDFRILSQTPETEYGLNKGSHVTGFFASVIIAVVLLI